VDIWTLAVEAVVCTTEVMGLSQSRNVWSSFGTITVFHLQARALSSGFRSEIVVVLRGAVWLRGVAEVRSRLTRASYLSLDQTSTLPSFPKMRTSLVPSPVVFFELVDRETLSGKAAEETSPPKRKQARLEVSMGANGG